jgi:DNA-directed RNA polymerase specialized sigma24 family protein
MSTADYLNIFALIQRGGRHRDRGADELFSLLAARLKAFFHRSGADDRLAEEAAIVGLGKLIEAIAAGPQTHSPAGWSWRVAQNAGRDFLKRERNVKAHETALAAGYSDDSDDDDVESMMEQLFPANELDAVTRICLEQQWARFWREQPEYANAFERVRLDGWSHGDLAAALGRKVDSMAEFLSQAKKALYRLFMHCLSDDEKWK